MVALFYDSRKLWSREKGVEKSCGIILPMKRKTTVNGFGQRLASYRRAKGLTQQALGEKVGVSNRVIAYYEGETDYPPAHLIVPLANALGITTDELLGMTEAKEEPDPANAALWRKLKVVESLPKRDQKAVLHYIRMITQTRGLKQKGGQYQSDEVGHESRNL
jgi:transcriptional regulator with XRE-family HTH domain